MSVDVIVVGAGPVGLTAAIELRRRGVDVLIVDKRDSVAPWAKAVGMQPRTLEIWDQVGVVDAALAASVTMRGQLAWVNGSPTGAVELRLPEQVPYDFICLPQYATEDVLIDHLASLGTGVTRGTELVDVDARDDGVIATLRDAGGERTVDAQYLIAAQGAHSTVRKALGIDFTGDAFAEEYMLADVELDWSLPAGYAVRSTHRTDGVVDDVLVCIPLPGRGRYRVSMLVPDELSRRQRAAEDIVAHGISGEGSKPELHHVQAVLDRLAPEPTTARALRWSSVFRISHRLADRYQQGRVFLAGDSAHIHPPTGAQGMNTGIQDAYNLGWKLALAVAGVAAPGLLESYHAERHPVGEEVVGRTVRDARADGVQHGGDGPELLALRQAQLLVGYPDSPIVGGDDVAGPRPGERAPDATGLHRSGIAGPTRFHELLRHPNHTLLLWAPCQEAWDQANDVAADARWAGFVRVVIAVPPALESVAISGSTVVDAAGNLATAYGFEAPAVTLIRPDGYLSHRSAGLDPDRVVAHLEATTLLLP